MFATIQSPLSPSSVVGGSADNSTNSKPHELGAVVPLSPVSPPLMSVATKSYVSSYGNGQHTDEMAQRPRSPASNYMQQTQRTSNSASFSTTPSSQEPGLKRPSPSMEENEHRDKRQKFEAEEDKMRTDNSVTATDHNRQKDVDVDMILDAEEPAGSQESEQGRQIGLDIRSNLQRDSGSAFLLCRSSVSRSRPDTKQHLLASYGLVDLLKSVARNDPTTGEKINKLRKSYEGQIKTFGLAGRNKPVKAEREEDQPGPLRSLATIRDEVWDNDRGKTTIDVAAPDFRSKLERALQIEPGKVRNNEKWEDLLGHEKPRTIISTPQPAPTTPRLSNGTNSSARPNLAHGQTSQSVAGYGAGPLDKRSTRGKKRSYSDNSFIGYGEGYSDGDDPGDVDDEYVTRKRKKVE